MTTGPIAKKTELLCLDAIFHLTSSAVNIVVEPLGTTFQIGEHVTRISTPIAVFGLGDDAPLLVPSLGLVLELGEESYFQSASAVLALSALLQPGRQRIESLILGQPYEVAHIVPLAPTQHFTAAKATVGP